MLKLIQIMKEIHKTHKTQKTQKNTFYKTAIFSYIKIYIKIST